MASARKIRSLIKKIAEAKDDGKAFLIRLLIKEVEELLTCPQHKEFLLGCRYCEEVRLL
ncbi:MAG: hypothetical protein ACUVTD_03915 [Nitrososphaerales archaeon]